MNKSGKMSHIALCIVKNKQIHLYINNIYYKIKLHLF